MIDIYLSALKIVADPYVLGVMVAAGIYGLFVGSMPGLSATMAVALLVPLTFFMPPVAAIAAIVTTSAMAIFSGDIPGCLLRIPGTPASAAYVDESYQMNLNGYPERAMGISLVFSTLGGIFGALVLIFTAPILADFALSFSSREFFWLVVLGLGGAVLIGGRQPLKALLTLFLGLALSMVGMENPAAVPRFTFGSVNLLSGFSLIPVMVGLFAVAEVFRFAIGTGAPNRPANVSNDGVFRGKLSLCRKYPGSLLRGSVLGTVIGALPGAGADIAAWLAYAVSKKLSKTPDKFGTGHPEGLIEASSANNGALGGTWIPALVFGIPGDSVTAIAIGVLYLKGLNPGPLLFIHDPESVYAIFITFLVANLLMLPLGWGVIKAARYVLRVPRNILMPIVLLFSIVGSYAINNSLADVIVMLAFGLLGFLLEENDYPVAPIILGVILGPMLERYFLTSIVETHGSFVGFVDRPLSAALAALTLAIVLWTLWSAMRSRRRG